MISTTIEQSIKLSELGIDPSTSDMHWESVSNEEYRLALLTTKETIESIERMQDSLKTTFNVKLVPAWSLSALMSMLPSTINIGSDEYCLIVDKYQDRWYVRYMDKKQMGFGYNNTEIITAVYDIVCYLIEEKLL